MLAWVKEVQKNPLQKYSTKLQGRYMAYKVLQVGILAALYFTKVAHMNKLMGGFIGPNMPILAYFYQKSRPALIFDSI